MSEIEVMAAEVAAHHANDQALSGPEIAALAGLAAGDSYAQLARRDGVAVDAVRHRASRAAVKLGAQSVTHAVAVAIRRGLIPGADA